MRSPDAPSTAPHPQGTANTAPAGTYRAVSLLQAFKLFLLLAAGSAGAAEPAATYAFERIVARNVAIPLYLKDEPLSAGSARIQQVRKSHRRLGFFRIGAAPEYVLETVQIKLPKPFPVESLPWHTLLNHEASNHCRLENVTLLFENEENLYFPSISLTGLEKQIVAQSR